MSDILDLNPMSSAPRDRTPILVKFKDNLQSIRDDLEPWNNVWCVMYWPHCDDEFKPGWSIAAPVGYGGFSDNYLLGWRSLENPESTKRHIVPQGWDLVPKQITSAMIEKFESNPADWQEVWKKILASAPCIDFLSENNIRKEINNINLASLDKHYRNLLKVQQQELLNQVVEFISSQRNNVPMLGQEAGLAISSWFNNQTDLPNILDLINQAKEQGVEEAAKKCDEIVSQYGPGNAATIAEYCSRIIRGLIEKKQ